MRLGLLLGAGGTVGLAYHVGVLRALDEAGLAVADADVVIGTSAGAVIGAYLRCGWSIERLWAELEEPPEPSSPRQAGLPRVLAPASSTPLGWLRRGMGSAFVLYRSVARFPAPVVPSVLGRVFPGGMCVMSEGARRLQDELATEWPDAQLWLATLDIVSGRRVVLGRPDARAIPLARAVQASCAIPGIYPPVRMGRRVLVDGGMHSTTNLDLALSAGCDAVVAVAPMAFDPSSAASPLARAVRRLPSMALAGEAALVRRQGVRALVVRPSAAEVDLQGANLMRNEGLRSVAVAAYETTLSRLRSADLLASLKARRAA